MNMIALFESVAELRFLPYKYGKLDSTLSDFFVYPSVKKKMCRKVWWDMMSALETCEEYFAERTKPSI